MFTISSLTIIVLVLAVMLFALFAAPATFRSLRSDSLIYGTTKFEGGLAVINDEALAEKMRRDSNHGVEYVEVHADPRVDQIIAQIESGSPPSTAVPDSAGVQTAPPANTATTTQTAATDNDGDGVEDRDDDEPPQNRKSSKSKR